MGLFHMNTRVSLQTVIRSYGLWVALLAVPLVVNGIIWTTTVIPQQAQLAAWRDTQRLATVKPALESALSESHRMLVDVERTGFASDDPSSVMQAVQRLAGLHRVQIKEVSAQGQQARARQGKDQVARAADRSIPGFAAMPMDLQVSGHFSKLGRWISDVEAQSGLQIESLAITAGKEPGEPHQLTIHLTAFLREA